MGLVTGAGVGGVGGFGGLGGVVVVLHRGISIVSSRMYFTTPFLSLTGIATYVLLVLSYLSTSRMIPFARTSVCAEDPIGYDVGFPLSVVELHPHPRFPPPPTISHQVAPPLTDCFVVRVVVYFFA